MLFFFGRPKEAEIEARMDRIEIAVIGDSFVDRCEISKRVHTALTECLKKEA